MVITGKVRGNASQLADYLLKVGDNERVIILDVNGRPNADPAYLKSTLNSMDINSELTRSDRSVYHATINPDPTSKEDRAMTMEEWYRSVEILGESLKLQEQRNAIVLHEKNGRLHAHIVFERYDHERGVMIDYKNNYNAHDDARFQMEKEFRHKATPVKNVSQPKHKQKLTEIWHQTKYSSEFIKLAQKNGYKIAKGTSRPFRVIDQNGRSFDLVKQIDGVKTKEVRARFKDTNLPTEKSAIKHANKAKGLDKLKDNSHSITLNPAAMSKVTNEQIVDMYHQHLIGEFSANGESITVKTEIDKTKLLNENKQLYDDARQKFIQEMRELEQRRKEKGLELS